MRCGSGTTALDIQNVIDSIQDNYSIPLITVTCELYNSKTWGSGFNSKKAGGFNKLIKTIHKEEKFYNVINFSGNDDIKEILNGLRSWSARMGISTLWIENELEFYGYKGMLKFAQKLLDLINNRSFVENIKKYATLPYQKWWMKEKSIKKEAMFYFYESSYFR
ncbi:hypothetical protein [Clostridium kluyveri]|uniref:hypothetical protein n=1 Tax=Clostridium kluyveri TaxID=1534 RepID=UPI00224797D4|nr:hypothetical protein [Clostridium kluyveri]UZQ48736.1 hypothetical protein OP486_12145 [Clostridium kluyveri]